MYVKMRYQSNLRGSTGVSVFECFHNLYTFVSLNLSLNFDAASHQEGRVETFNKGLDTKK